METSNIAKQRVVVVAPAAVRDAVDGCSGADSRNKYDIPDGLTKSQKKNLRKKLRGKEIKAEEAAGIRKGVPQMPEDRFETERAQVVQSVIKAMGKLPSLAEMKSADVLEKFRDQQETLQELLRTTYDAQERLVSKIDKPDNRSHKSVQLLERLRELFALPERDELAVEYLEAQLAITAGWENAKKFQTQLNEIRLKIEERQKTNQKHFDGARVQEQKMKLSDRVKALHQSLPQGGKPAGDITAGRVFSVEMEVSADAQLLLLPPSNISRRMEKIFTVATDRSPDKSRQRVYTVSGLKPDLDEAVQFLQQADFSGGCKVAVEPKLMPQLIGKGGSAIKQLEATFKCFFQTRDTEVVVYGSKANAARAIQHISQMKVERQGQEQMVAVVFVKHPAIARSLLTAFSKAVADIGDKHAVNIRVTAGPPPKASNAPDNTRFGADLSKKPVAGSRAPPPQTMTTKQESSPGASVFIRGINKTGVDAARTAIADLVSVLQVVELPSTAEALKRLFSCVRFNGEVDLSRDTFGRAAQPSVGDRFRDLVGLNDTKVAMMRHGDALAIVGQKDAISTVLDAAKQLMEVAAYTATKLSVRSAQLAIFPPTRLSEISAATGASVSVTRRRLNEDDDSAVIEIVGSENQKAAATTMVNEAIEAEASAIETLQLNDRETLSQLLRQAGAQIRMLEEQFGTRIAVDRTSMTCTVMGSREGVSGALSALKQVDAKNVELEVRNIPVPSPDFIGRLIGPKGATVNRIRAASKAESIDINDKDMIVTIRGTPEACDDAEQQVNELFASTSSPFMTRQSPPAVTPTPASTSKAQTVVALAPLVGVGWGEDVGMEIVSTAAHATTSDRGVGIKSWAGTTSPSSRGPGVSVTVGSEAFPSLSQVVNLGKQTKRPRRRKQGQSTTSCSTPPSDQEGIKAVDAQLVGAHCVSAECVDDAEEACSEPLESGEYQDETLVL